MGMVYISIYYVVAAILSVVGAVAVFAFAFNRRIAPDVMLFYIAAAAGALGYFIGSRDLSSPDLADISAETWAGRLANLSALGLCLIATIKIGINGIVSRASIFLAVGTLQYYFICFILPISFDPWYIFDHRILYPLFSLPIVLMPATMNSRGLGTNFARATTVVSFLSLSLIFYKYDSAVLSSYDSILPFFKGRLYGATPHPNVLGPMAAFAILLISVFPPRHRIEFWFLLAINLTALILSESKTAWLTLLLSQAILHFSRLKFTNVRLPAWFYVLGFMTVAAVPAALSLVNRSIYGAMSGNSTFRSLSTLTGRTDIWHATFFLIKQHSLVFGPGYATYLVYMQSLFPSLIANPHNLYLATMVQAGLIGLASLIIYLLSLAGAAASLEGRERLFGFAYIAIIITRGMSEAVSFQSAFTAPNFWTLLMFMRLMAVMASEKAQRTNTVS